MTNESGKNDFDPEMDMTLHGQPGSDDQNNEPVENTITEEATPKMEADQTTEPPSPRPQPTVLEGGAPELEKESRPWKISQRLHKAQSEFRRSLGLLGTSTMSASMGVVGWVNFYSAEMQQKFADNPDLIVKNEVLLGLLTLLGVVGVAGGAVLVREALKNVREMRQAKRELAESENSR